MSEQYHYVVMYDTATDKFSVDVDTCMSVMQHGAVWSLEDGWIEDGQNSQRYLDVEDALAVLLQEGRK